MAEKKTTTTKKTAKKIKIVYKGVKYEFDPNEFLPFDFVESKLSESQQYVPVWIYREIMRQLGEFGEVKFSKPEVVVEAKGNSGPMFLYRVECEVEWKKKNLILRGSGYQHISLKAMVSDAAHGNFKTLEAKALRDALKYAYKIFEFPNEEEVYMEEIVEDKLEKAKEILKTVEKKEKNQLDKIVETVEKKEEKTKETKVEEDIPDLSGKPELKVKEEKKEEKKENDDEAIKAVENLIKENDLDIEVVKKIIEMIKSKLESDPEIPAMDFYSWIKSNVNKKLGEETRTKYKVIIGPLYNLFTKN